MGAHLKLVINFSGSTTAQLVAFQKSDEQSNFLERLAGKSRESFDASGTATSVVASTNENGTQATATITCVTVGNNATVTIGNVAMTGKTSAPSGQAQFLCGVSATADGAALAVKINAHTTLSTWLSAASAVGVVTLTVLDYDTRGNAYALTSSDGTNLALVGFTGGVTDASVQTFNV